jgi:hypothetical protein
MVTQHVVRAVLITCLLSACAAIEKGRSAPTSTEVTLEATSRSALGSTSDQRTLRSDSIVNDLDEIGAGPKTDRAVGIVALVTVLATFTMILIGLYKLAQLF